MSRPWIRLSAAASVSSLAVGMWLSGELVWLAAVVLSATLLVLGAWRGRRWTTTAWFVLQVTVVAAVGQPAALLLPALLLALVSWDLEDFGSRLRQAPNVIDQSGVVRRHLWVLALSSVVGATLSGAALLGRLRLSFAAAAGLGLLALAGLSRLIRTRQTPTNLRSGT